MPIITSDFGAHKDVLFLEFVDGDIMFTRSTMDGDKHQSGLIFSHMEEPHEIGAETNDYADKSSDALPNVKIVMRFSKPESITALIHSLVEIQKEIFRSQRV